MTPPVAVRRRAPLFALLAATGISYAGNTMTLVAVPWFVLQTTGSAGRAGLAAFFATLPMALSAGLGGALVDRLGYRRASITADIASGVTIALAPILYLTVGLPFWGLLVLVFLGAMLDGVERASRMAGGPIAGILIAVVGASQVLLVDAATFALSAALLTLMVPRAVRAADEPHQRATWPSCARASPSSATTR